MTIYNVEKDNRIIGTFLSIMEVVLFLELHKDDFGYDDKGRDFVTEFRNGMEIIDLNLYLKNAYVTSTETGIDYYTDDLDEMGRNVRDIAKSRPEKAWTVTMDDNTKRTISAPFKALAVEKAQTLHILETDMFQGVAVIEPVK